MRLRDQRLSMVDALTQAVSEGLELIVVVSDSTSTSRIKPFAEKYPDRVVNVGIAEQNLIGISAGLALGGYVVVTANAASFLTSRSAEQVRNDVAYTNSNVKMMGLNPGFAYGSLGPTHHSIEDISMMRSMAGVRIFTPIDPSGTGKVVSHVLRTDGPAYVRVDSGVFQDLTSLEEYTAVDEPVQLSEGGDITVLGLGTSSHAVLEASKILNHEGIKIDGWGIPSIRPLKMDSIKTSAMKSGIVITVEAHSTHGGLGSMLSEKFVEQGLGVNLKRLGVTEGVFAPASPRPAIEKLFRLDSEGIAETVRDLLR